MAAAISLASVVTSRGAMDVMAWPAVANGLCV